MNLFRYSVKNPPVDIEDFMIRQNRRAFWIILTCSLYILGYQYFGTPMSCMGLSKSQKLVHSSIPPVQQRFLDEFCYRTAKPLMMRMVHAIVHESFSNRTLEEQLLQYLDPQLQKIPSKLSSSNAIDQEGGSDILPHWKPFPFFLLLLAMLFWIPRNFLSYLHSGISYLVEMVDQRSENDPDFEMNLNRVARRIKKSIRSFKHWAFLSHFILCQFMLLFNAIIQLYLIHNIFFSAASGKILPKAAKCLFPLTFGVEESEEDGQEEFQESLCIIFLNFHMEIIFRTVWAILWIATGISLLGLTLDFVNYLTGGFHFKMKILQRAGIPFPSYRKRLDSNDEYVIAMKLFNRMSMADLFFLKKLSENLRPTTFYYILGKIACSEDLTV